MIAAAQTVTLTIEELAALLTHADRATPRTPMPEIGTFEPWREWRAFARRFAERRCGGGS